MVTNVICLNHDVFFHIVWDCTGCNAAIVCRHHTHCKDELITIDAFETSIVVASDCTWSCLISSHRIARCAHNVCHVNFGMFGYVLYDMTDDDRQICMRCCCFMRGRWQKSPTDLCTASQLVHKSSTTS